VAAGVGFLVFAVLALRRNEEEELEEEESEVATIARSRRRAPWMAAFLVVFAAEWGDLSQLATASLVAKTGQPLPVAIGAIAALLSVTVIAVATGSQLTRFLAPELLTRVSAGLFAVVGVVIIVQALR
jgi:putative Ca2+/H+ antiporter (TMEM165/GDT1 family)